MDDDIEGRTTAGGTYYQRHAGGEIYRAPRQNTLIHTSKRTIDAVTMNKKDLFHSTVPNGSSQVPVILPVAVVVVVV